MQHTSKEFKIESELHYTEKLYYVKNIISELAGRGRPGNYNKITEQQWHR